MEVVKTTPQEIATVSVEASSDVMGMINRFVSDPSFDVIKLEKLMDLQQRVDNQNAQKAYAADFVRLKPNLPRVVSKSKNAQTNSKYAKLEDINDVIDPILEKYGFGTSTKIISQNDTSVTVRCEVLHRMGHVEFTQISMPLDDVGIAGKTNKTKPHAIASTITYLKRIGICALLNISTGDDNDGNKDKGEDEYVSIEQAAEIDVLITNKGAIKQNVLNFAGADDVRNIPLSKYQSIITNLNKMPDVVKK